MLIYVAGPLSSSCPEAEKINVDNAMYAGRVLLELGHYPLIPHLDTFAEENDWGGSPGEWGEIPWGLVLAWDLEMLSRCDALLILGNSPGVTLEAQRAKQLKIPIYYGIGDIGLDSNYKKREEADGESIYYQWQYHTLRHRS